MKPAVIAYLPPPSHGNPQAFLANMQANPAGVDVHFYSDHAAYGVNPCQSPTVVFHPHAKFRISNHAFLSGLKLAIDKEVTHMLYVEEDSRVLGDGWAERLFQEFLTYPNATTGGTPVAYNISDSGHIALRRVTEFAADYLRAAGTPMTIHGYEPHFYFYPNGSLSILDVQMMQAFFPAGFENDISRSARTNMAWDEIIGRSLWATYGVDVFDHFAPSVLSYSGCGDRVYTEKERIEMLESGSKLAVHQVKSSWTTA